MDHTSSTSSSKPGHWAQGRLWWLALLLVVFVGDTLATRVLDRLTLSSEARFSKLYAGRLPKNAVWIIGNSRALNTFYAPTLSDRTQQPVINLSYNGLSMSVIDVLLRDALERNGRPRRVVIEVSAVLQSGEVLDDLRMYTRFSPRLAELNAQVLPQTHAISRVVGLYSYNSETFFRVLHYLDKSDQDWINRYHISADTLRKIKSSPATRHQTRPAELAALKRTLAWLAAEGLESKLVLGPYLPEYAAKISNLADWRSELERELRQPIVDLSDAVLETSAFADGIHLNEQGGKLLADIVVRGGLF
jgi:hypothetical protein